MLVCVNTESSEMTFLRYETRGGLRFAVFRRTFEIDYIMGDGKAIIEGDASYSLLSLKSRIANLEKAGHDASVSKRVLDNWPEDDKP